MKLYEWAEGVFKNGVELFSDSVEVKKGNAVITRDTTILRKLSIAAVSAGGIDDFYDMCRLTCPVGTIIEQDKRFEQLYKDVILQCKLELTKQLLNERNAKSAKIFLEILSKRDPSNWSDKKSVEVSGNNEFENRISINIVTV